MTAGVPIRLWPKPFDCRLSKAPEPVPRRDRGYRAEAAIRRTERLAGIVKPRCARFLNCAMSSARGLRTIPAFTCTKPRRVYVYHPLCRFVPG